MGYKGHPHPHVGYGYLTTPLRNLLSDGEWHDLNVVTSDLMQSIKPEIAVRRYRRRNPHVEPNTDIEHQIMQGSRYIVWDALRRIDGIEKRGDRWKGFQYRLPLIRSKAS